MVLYVFRCDTGCGTTQQMHAMHSRPDVVECPDCGGAARRMIGAPHLAGAGKTAMALQDATRATADCPGVVATPGPATHRRSVSANPLHRRLPRP